VRPTYIAPRAAEYGEPGGPWDVPTLDALLGGDPQLAAGLRAAGVARGDVVAWQAPNVPAVPRLYRACWQLGAIAAPLHHLASTAEVDRMLGTVEPKVFITADELTERIAQLEQAGSTDASDARAEDLAAVLFTAGSSGDPKGALHTHRSLAHKARTMVGAHGLTADDVVLMPAPLAHISGLLNGVLVPGAAGMRTILMPKWDTEEALRIIEREGVTFMIGPPTFFVGLMDAPGFATERVRTLRLVSSGGAGVTPAFVETATERLGAIVKRSYGSTEAPTITTSLAGDPPERARETDGRVVGAAEIRVAPDGELLVRGPELFAGYVDAAQTERAIADGWFRTGDLATIDEGWLTIVGRKKDVIIRGGENIAAAEVEHVLETHPSVRQAVAVGYPDPRLGERVCAVVVADAPFDLDACRDWFASQGVARFKTPERVVRVASLPVLGAGKVDRAAVRELVVAGLTDEA
jgi:cyclohexanecarboxylate-CoA ligase